MLTYTALKDTNRQTLRNIIPLAKPFTLVVEPSALCNFRCKMCFQSTAGNAYFNAKKRIMQFELFEAIVRQMQNWGATRLKVLKLSLYGEPLINPDFCKMLSLSRNAGIAERIETTSNVSLLTPKISESLVTGGLDYIRVSIYSPYADKHAEITGQNKIKPQDIHNNLATLQEIKAKQNSKTPFVAVKMLDTYGEENDAFREMYKDVADEIYIDKPHNWVSSSEKSFIEELYGANEIVVEDMNSHDTGAKACSVSFYTLSVRNNGDVAPCCVDYAGGTNVANMRDTNLREIWQGDAMRKFWTMQLLGENFRNPSCARCELYKSDYYSRDNVDDVPIERLLKNKECIQK